MTNLHIESLFMAISLAGTRFKGAFGRWILTVTCRSGYTSPKLAAFYTYMT